MQQGAGRGYLCQTVYWTRQMPTATLTMKRCLLVVANMQSLLYLSSHGMLLPLYGASTEASQVLSACNFWSVLFTHAGCSLLESQVKQYRLAATASHTLCLVMSLGRSAWWTLTATTLQQCLSLMQMNLLLQRLTRGYAQLSEIQFMVTCAKQQLHCITLT